MISTSVKYVYNKDHCEQITSYQNCRYYNMIDVSKKVIKSVLFCFCSEQYREQVEIIVSVYYLITCLLEHDIIYIYDISVYINIFC